jgi:peptidylprolyl isomerase
MIRCTALIAGMVTAMVAGAAIAEPPKVTSLSLADLLKASPASDWRALDPQNVMVIDLPAGRVIIELAPDYAPANVAAVRSLVKEGYFDGSVVLRSQDNYVVQWARPETDERAKAMASKTLEPEFARPIDSKLPFTRLPYPDTYAQEVGFSGGFRVARDLKRHETWLVHCYGSVGVGRDNAFDSGNGSELYAVIGQSPRTLDRNITLVGRVVQGIELFSAMPRGTGAMGFYEKPSEWISIRSARMMADVPTAERIDLEALRTESKTFKALVESRVRRREAWFKESPGRIDVCSVPLPVRARAQN